MSEDKEPIRVRAHLMKSYVENMVEYMKSMFPNSSQEEIDNFVRTETQNWCEGLKQRYDEAKANGDSLTKYRPRDKMLWPTLNMIKHTDQATPGLSRHSYGNITEFKDEDLLNFVTAIKSKIVSPSGSVYEITNVKSSFLKGMVDTDKKQRKVEKGLMLKAKKDGNRTAEIYHNNNQATIKIRMNSLIGSMGSGFNLFSSKANFNSVTSIARFFIMNSYAHGERFLESNFYFLNEEQATNFLIICKKYGPASNDVMNLVNSEKLFIPSVDDVYKFIVDNLHKYVTVADRPDIRTIITNMTDGERCFVYYMSNFRHLVFNNEHIFRPWMDGMFPNDLSSISFNSPDEYYKPDGTIVDSVDPEELFGIDGDLIVVLSTVYDKWLPENEKGNSVSVYDTVLMDVELAKKLVVIAKYLQGEFDKLDKFVSIFINHNVNITNVIEHKNMFRDTIILSDTDSIVFTTKSWIEWFTGGLKLNEHSFNINAVLVYIFSKANRLMLHNVSRALGTTGKDTYMLDMKNEFFMPIELLTSLKKHYVAMLKIQEGVVYSTPRLDIKGVGLRGSSLSRYTLQYVTWFIQKIIDGIYENGALSVKDMLLDIMRFERLIYDSLLRHEVSFLIVNSIKNPDQYSDADKSIHYNYLFWEGVFAEKYGNIMIPTKCYMVPLTNVNNPIYLDRLKESSPDMHKRLTNFFKENVKDLTRIPINPIVDSIPEELHDIIHYRKIIYSNASPLYLLMKSFGISTGISNKQMSIVSDMYGWVTEEESVKVLPHTGIQS